MTNTFFVDNDVPNNNNITAVAESVIVIVIFASDTFVVDIIFVSLFFISNSRPTSDHEKSLSLLFSDNTFSIWRGFFFFFDI